jgi:fumarate reductase flavoprotein subunit
LSEGLADPAVVRRAVEAAPAMVDWLLEAGLRPLDDHPVTGASPGRPGYGTPRYLWACGQGRDILALLRPALAPLIDDGRIRLVTAARVDGLVPGADGGVDGVTAATRGGGRLTARARRTLLATGGYAMERTLLERFSGRPAYAALACPTARGDGLALAATLGGALRGHDLHRPGTGLVLEGEDWPARVFARAITAPQLRAPWEIWVDDDGRRFVREDEPVALTRERALLALPRCRFHAIGDAAVLDAAPPMIEGRDRTAFEALCGAHPMFHRAGSLEELAARAGIGPRGLVDAVRGYNAAVQAGRDPLGRLHLPRPIERPPFHAVTLHGASATSAVGVTVDDGLRVLRADGGVIARLHAAGEVLGSGATLGQAFVPGMMLTPALALGRWLGRRLAEGQR